MKKRTFGITFIQILLIICGIVGLVYLVALFVPVFKVLFTDKADFGDVLATILFALPFIIILSPIVCLDGIITTVIAARQRKDPEKKDALALLFLILGIAFIVLSVVMLAFILLKAAGDSGSSEAALLVLLM